jgi:hypothetical protein
VLTVLSLQAGEFTSVPLHDPVYQILESAQIRGIIKHLPTTKPYSRKRVRDALEEMVTDSRLTQREIVVAQAALRQISTPEHKDILSNGALFSSGEYLDAQMGVSIDIEQSVKASQDDMAFTSVDFLNLYLSGDLKAEDPILSYRFDMGFGVLGVISDFNQGTRIEHYAAQSYAPYTFEKSWEGYTYPLLDPFNFGTSSSDAELDIAFSMDPEIAIQLFGDHLRLSFSRIPRNWGIGEDSLMLSGTANPFVAVTAEAKIFDWMDYAFLFGSLENYGDSGRFEADKLQSLVTLHSVDVRPFNWLYLGVHEGVVWPKRFELGYMNPLIFSSLYQGMIGDFDNILGGLSLGLSLPGYAEVYGSFFFDEFRPRSFSDLSERVRNFFSYKVGVKAHVPYTSFGTFTAQYTKIEPFTYTHPETDVPWMEGEVHESFVTNGDGLVSKLDPNSDELLICFDTFVSPSIQLRTSYQMIRHGEYGGDYNKPLDGYNSGDENNGILPDDMDYADGFGGNSSSDVDGIEGLRKDFLRDGDYDWYHILALGGTLNLKGGTGLPLRIKVTDSLVYHFRTDEHIQKIEGESTGLNNYLTIAMQVWGD